jgi:hypothetical protein
MIISTVSRNDFFTAFHNMGRSNQFSYNAKDLLYNFLEDYSDSIGEPVELDIIALCCDFSEEEPAEIARNYDLNLDLDSEIEDQIAQVTAQLESLTTVLGDTGSRIVYQVF